VPIGLDATYSLGRNPSGVAVYSREILFGLAQAHPEEQFLYYYRPHRFLRSLREQLPRNAGRRMLRGAPRTPIFHALNQRVDEHQRAGDPARRTVTTFHDLFVMSAEYSSPEFRERFTEQARAAAERSDLMIAVSKFTATQVQEFLGVEASRIRVIPHGARAPARISRARENLVLTVGAVQKRKNIGRLVKAFERMPRGWKLAIAGAGEGYGAAEELRAVDDSGRRNDIEVLGYVPAAALEQLYGRASIFAFPSLDEGFGMPVLDAMARGVPVVTSLRSAIPEVAGDAAILVDPENIEELGDALARLAENGELRRDLERRGLLRATELTWEKAVERTWSVYREFM
jgi:glycosyltransferase involved in cell wall biosynthesis